MRQHDQHTNVEDSARCASATGSAKWEWDSYVSFHNIGQRPATCENKYCGKNATVIVEDENSYSWCCNDCARLVPNGKTVWPNEKAHPTAAKATVDGTKNL